MSKSDVISFDSVSKVSTKSHMSHAVAQAAEKAIKKIKEKEAHPERRLLFRPKVYDAWKNEDIEDEIEEQERLIREISKQEKEIDQKKEEGEYDSDDDIEAGLEAQRAALERLKNRKHREEMYRGRLEAEMLREEREKAELNEEKHNSELHNPSKYGWYYTDGYYDDISYFGVKETFIKQLLEDREAWKEKWLIKHPETFTEKFKRFFWPPNVFFKKKMFRTRGTYMDFPEVIADWPKPLDINFEKEEREFIANDHALFQEDMNEEALIGLIQEHEIQKEEYEAELAQLAGSMFNTENVDKDNPDKVKLIFDISQGKDYNWDDWYYDDDSGEFIRKKDGFAVDFYMDSKNNCWRRKRLRNKKAERQPTPYDWYFDFDTGKFLAREDYKGLDEFVYDHKNGVYRIVPIIPTAVKKGRNSKSKAAKKSAGTEDEESVKNKLKNYYFDEEEGNWKLKDDAPEERRDEILFDENGQRFARKVEGEWRGLTGFSPDDYFFDDKSGQFQPKPKRQGKNFKYYGADGVWRKASAPAPDPLKRTKGKTPSDYYFDEFEGQFKVKVAGAVGNYWLQKHAHIWRKNPEPISGKYPEDFYWDRSKKLWIPRVVRMDMLHNARSAKNQWTSEITQGQKSEMVKPESFFWDIEEGVFSIKAKNTKYYLDKDGFWKSVALKNKARNRIYPYDFFYDSESNQFVRKKKGETYVFNTKASVWTTKDAPEEFKCDFVFDVQQEHWTETGSFGTDGYTDIGIIVRPHPNANYKIPSDFWFNDVDGRFYPKKPEDVKQYYYNPSEGAWKKKGIPSKDAGLHPRNFFFDESANSFKLMVDGQKKDYWFDTNNKIYRHVVAAGVTRTGHQPTDYYWNSDLKFYVLENPKDKLRGKIVSDLPEWEPMRRYTKGWLPSIDPSVSTVGTVRKSKVKNKKDKKKSSDETPFE